MEQVNVCHSCDAIICDNVNCDTVSCDLSLSPRVAAGADIRSVCTEAGMFAIRERRKVSSPGGGEVGGRGCGDVMQAVS